VKISSGDVHLCRVLSDAEDSVIIEVIKDETATLQLSDDATENVFYTVIFVRQDPDARPGTMEVWTPWET
jgi:hypothetical protein